MKRIQRALAACEAEAERIQGRAVGQFNELVAVMREITALATEHAESLDTLRLHQAGRFDVLTRVHAMLLRDGGRSIDLECLVWDELSATISPAEEDRITIAGPSVALERQAAELLALMLHELTTNALKFGALSDDEGCVQVTWHVSPAPGSRLYLSWSESGVTAPAQIPVRRGFGRELIENLVPRRLNAETRFILATSGLRCEMELPLSISRSEASADMAVAA